MINPYITAYNIEVGRAVEPSEVKAMAIELRKLKHNYEEQNRKLGGLKQDLHEAIGDAGDIVEQTTSLEYKGAKSAYEATLFRMNYLDL